jgi:hypothetical protein
LADFELITAFNLSQITGGFGDSGYQATAAVEFVGLTAEPETEPAPEPAVRTFGLDRGDEDGDITPPPSP